MAATHDVNFKNLILDFLRSSIEFFAGREVGVLPADAVVTPLREEQSKQWMHEKGFELDMAVKVEWPDGKKETIIFCIEHNTRERPGLLKRHAIYCLKTSLLHETDRVVPVAIFPHEHSKIEDHFALSGDSGVYLDFRCITVKLKELEAREFINSRNIVARLCLPLMRHNSNERERIADNALTGLIELESNTVKRMKYVPFIMQYSEIRSEDEIKDFTRRFASRSKYKEDFMSMYEVILNMGKKEGKAEGSAEGKVPLAVSLFKKGRLKLSELREELEDLVANGGVPRELADSALKEIRRSR
jgi:hypothetical protein